MDTPIAIVGMACRFPGGVSSLHDLWELLIGETDAVTHIPAERFGTDFHQHPAKREPGKSYTFAAGVLDDVMSFDAGFFGVSPREAAQMDPQQRLLLELAWETFEDAGHPPTRFAGSQCAVFVGVSSQDYGNRNLDDLSIIDAYSATGNTSSIVSNRISYLFDLRGPSMSIDTACSSSLVAVHQACLALRAGEADSALAGGVNLLLHPFPFIGFSKASMLSPGGRCRAFDASGDGYVRSEGGALILLKTLERARADGDTVHAVIVSSGVNSDGHSQGGINVPASATQAALLKDVYARARIDPREVHYVEAHGTGTAVGDPVEARALADVLGSGRAADKPLLIGSAKSNLGHLEPASGMAGLFKTVLGLKHRALPASIHFRQPNPGIDFAGGGLRVVDRFTPMDTHAGPLVFGVNSFGFGGTNAHVVLRETEPEPVAPSQPHAAVVPFEHAHPLPLVLSARSPQALRALARAYSARLGRGDHWNALATGAARKREWMSHRAVLGPTTAGEGAAWLDRLAEGDDAAPLVTGTAPAGAGKLALVFSGNGAQWAQMGRRLLEEDAGFRTALAELDVLWQNDGSSSVVAELREGVSAERLALTECAQPLLFAVQVGVVRVLQARGVRFDACVGHSVGEAAAAWAAGALTLEQAIRVIKVRSGAQARTRGTGKMAAAGLSETSARQLLDTLGLADQLEIAGINSPQSVTLSGAPQALQRVQEHALQNGQFFQILDLDYAFHSDRMDPIEAPVVQGLADLAPRATHCLFASAVTGGMLDGEALGATYWWRNIREPVRFEAATQALLDAGVTLFLEVGPHPILRTYLTQTITQAKRAGRALPTLARNQDGAADLRAALHGAIANGAALDLDKAYPSSDAAQACCLPTYPWQREPHMTPATAEGYGLIHRRRVHPLLGYRLREHAAAWENQIDPLKLPMLADHVVDGAVTFPGAGYAEMALAAARIHFGVQACALANLEIHTPVVFEEQRARLFRFMIDPQTASFKIETRPRMSEEPWTLNVTGRLLAGGPGASGASLAMLEAFERQPAQDAATLYASAAQIGLTYGATFRWVSALRVDGDADAALAELAVPAALAETLGDYVLHPAAMDSGFHALFAILARDHAADDEAQPAYVPVQLARVDYYDDGDANHVVRALARIVRRNPHSLVASFTWFDANGRIIAKMDGCRFRRVNFSQPRGTGLMRLRFVAEAQPYAAQASAAALAQPAALLDAGAATAAARNDVQQRELRLDQVLPLFDVLSACYALRAVEALGAVGAAALPDTYNEPLFRRLVAMLVEDGVLAVANGRIERGTETLPPTEELWRTLLALSPAHAAELTLIALCGAALPAVLKGEVAAGTVLAPSSSDLVGHLHESSPGWLHASARVHGALEAALESWREPRKLRVLELVHPGTALVAPIGVDLAARCDYALAGSADEIGAIDLSATPLVRSVRVEAGGASGEPVLVTEPGRPDHYDIVIVRNRLRAGAQPEQLLRAVREWMTPDATLIVANSLPGRFEDIVFGLDVAAWTGERADLLGEPQIEALVRAAGFEHLACETEGERREGVPVVLAARRAADVAPTLDTAPSSDTRATNWLVLFDGAQRESFAEAIVQAFYDADQQARACALSVFEAQAAMLTQNGARRNVVFVGANDVSLPPDADGAMVMAQQEGTVIALARLARWLATTAQEVHGGLWVVTSGAAPVAGVATRAQSIRPDQATLWGLARVLMNEHTELGVRLVDIEPGVEGAAAALVRELLARDSGEDEVMLGARGRFVSRMLPVALDELRAGRAQSACGAVLGLGAQGSLRNLEWFAQPPVPLRDDEVEIEPVAAGLNFRDVMYSMGLLSDEAVENGFAGPTIGMECAGRIVRVGAAVDGYAPGDAVLGFAPATFASRARTYAAAIVRKPAGMTFEEAATIPTVFFTVYYALCELARLRAGERVLVHGAAGGVGIAAVQLAKHLGAEVFATAGSNEKREFVRLLGADHVLDSRTLAFAEEVMQRTGGAGVDIVLNSLAGEAMVRSIDVLRPFGRFLELGKRDFYNNTHIGLRPLRNNISYFGIDADQLMSVSPELTIRIFGTLMQLFEAGALSPLPYRAFAAARAGDAFSYMQQARQIGKILIDLRQGAPAPQAASTPLWQASAQATYLVVGGTSGLGFATAGWLVRQGARHLVLASRSAKLTPEGEREVQRWRNEHGVTLMLAACDVGDAAAVEALVARCDSTHAPLKGVVHSALTIADGLVANLDDDSMRRVMAPKVAGAWNLHQATRGKSLDFFVVYSSATTFLGNPGQSNYVAANTFLESLVLLRRASGQPATFMSWGPIDDVGFLARNQKTRDALEARIGGRAITSHEAMNALERVLAQGLAGEALLRVDWSELARVIPAARAPRYVEMRSREAGDAQGIAGASLRDEVLALAPEAARERVAEALRAEIGRILNLAMTKIELERPVLEMGFDSLMGMELRMAVEERLQVKLSVMMLAQGATVNSLAQRIVELMQAGGGSGSAPTGVEASLAQQAAALEQAHAVEVSAEALQAVAQAAGAADKRAASGQASPA
ncbi:SDR family NAD(P)-dependent oxidoreductase [Paraburkholderia sp. J67]|uniref:SDR family NAD(P)-dependent oxidoreductase n=1 Tax=Paraburkholderia sp. J67 TaxID=2805435 RepID=UPI002ABE7B1D|nr:SDR family NAD(P)-dependent oxidoreductase [Paraburkholderia sp. J67]